GSRAVVTRRGARYTKPGKSLTLDQLDRGRRFEIDPDTGTYVEQAFADIRRRREAELSGAEKALGIDSAEAPPALPVSVDRTGERLQVHGRHCERVMLSSTREAVVGAGRGARAAAARRRGPPLGARVRGTPAGRAPGDARPRAGRAHAHRGGIARRARVRAAPDVGPGGTLGRAVRSLDNSPRRMLYLALPA